MSMYRALFEDHPQALFVYDPTTMLMRDANHAGRRLLGLTHEDIPRTSVLSFLSPDAQQEAMKLREQEQGNPTQSIWNVTDPTGRERWVEVHANNIEFEGEDLRVFMVIDVTERHQVKVAYEQTLRRFQAFMDHAPVGVMSIDADRRVLMWNPSCEKIFGWSKEEVLGEILPFVDIESQEHVRFFEMVKRGEVVNAEIERTRKDGSIVPVALSAAPVFEDGALVQIVAIIIDRSRQKELENSLRQSQKMEAVGLLAGGIAHDFNNLLAVIMSFTDLLLESTPVSDPRTQDLKQVRWATEQGADLTRQLLAFSRRQVLRMSVFEVDSAIAQLERMLRRVMRPGIAFLLDLHASHITIRADRTQFEQVLLNLALNARDAIGETGGTLAISSHLISEKLPLLDSLEGDDFVRIRVKDNGKGISPDDLERIFEPFFTTKGRGKGTGLGLSTAFGIVSQSGGCIDVHSAEGAGSTFDIYWPVHYEEDTQVIPDLEPPARKAKQPGRRIILVEDHEALRVITERVLKRAGYHVTGFEIPSEALTLLEDTSHTVDLLISDVILPQMSGPELYTRVMESRPELRVLFISGYAEDSLFERGIDSDSAPFLAKPYTPEVLIERVREILHE